MRIRSAQRYVELLHPVGGRVTVKIVGVVQEETGPREHLLRQRRHQGSLRWRARRSLLRPHDAPRLFSCASWQDITPGVANSAAIREIFPKTVSFERLAPAVRQGTAAGHGLATRRRLYLSLARGVGFAL